VTVTEASPREATVAATAAAVEWLADYLHDGPRYSAALRRDAVADGLQLPALHRAAGVLDVRRIQASRWSRWSLAEHAEATAEKRCTVCHEVLDREAFRRPPTPAYPAGRMLPTCGPCTDRRSCRPDKRRPAESPALTEALLDRTASFAPDPGTARVLRHGLVAARRAGQSFEDAWDAAMAAALDTAGPREVESWEKALASTKGAWSSAYHREDALAGHAAVSTLAEAA
jgi:hypothetical protein